MTVIPSLEHLRCLVVPNRRVTGANSSLLAETTSSSRGIEAINGVRASVSQIENSFTSILPIDWNSVDLKNQVPRLVGESNTLIRVNDLILRVAKNDSNVLITGETGTGKELAAKLIHEHSPRKGNPFVSVNCSAISESLIESILFGHERGSFTGAVGQRKGLFEIADRGTVFLDEIGELDQRNLLKLQRLLQNGKIRRIGSEIDICVNVRVISATNKHLERLVTEEKFPLEVYHLLRRSSIHMPALREHKEDIPDIVANLLIRNKFISPSKVINGISLSAIELLNNHDWAGNVRELENVIRRAVVYANGEFIQPQDIAIDRQTGIEKSTENILSLVKSNGSVVIYSEPGIDVESIASNIHQLSSRSGAFVVLDCLTLTENLLDSQLFGHAKGAFTGAASDRRGYFEQANGGTLVLLNIDEMPIDSQTKLLRVLQEGELNRVGEEGKIVRKVYCRVIVSSKKDLEQLVREGKMRDDLFYRLNVLPLKVIPLRERIDEIELLALGILDKMQVSKKITPEAILVLRSHNWPCNFEELKSVVLQAIDLAGDSESIEPKHIVIRNLDPGSLTTKEYPLINKCKVQFVKLVTGNNINVDEVSVAGIRFYVANKLAREVSNISQAELQYKFSVHNSNLYKLLNKFDYRGVHHLTRILIKEDQTNGGVDLNSDYLLHPVLDRYVTEFLEEATKDEPTSFDKLKLLAIKCSIINSLLEGDQISRTSAAEKFGLQWQAFYRFLKANGYDGVGDLISQLSKESRLNSISV